MSEIQVIFWRDIPAQVKARGESARTARALTPRFQEAIDAAAMTAGMSDSEAYLGAWRSGAWEPAEGSPEEAAERRAMEIENAYPKDRLLRLVASGGSEA